jgi:RNA polymerase sigma factor (sigma-70 family)
VIAGRFTLPPPPTALFTPRVDAPALSLSDLAPLYRAHWRMLHGIARRLVGPVEADAVVQDVFLDLLRKQELRERFLGGAVGAWLGEVTRRKALEHLRRLGREVPTDDVAADAASPEADLTARNLVERFMADHVPEAQRPFFKLRFLERHTQVEVAALLGVPRSTLEGWEHRLSRALKAFVLQEMP